MYTRHFASANNIPNSNKEFAYLGLKDNSTQAEEEEKTYQAQEGHHAVLLKSLLEVLLNGRVW